MAILVRLGFQNRKGAGRALLVLITMFQYSAKYIDINGVEQTTIYNDSQNLRLTIKGVEFSGPAFDMLEPADDATAEEKAPFSFSHDCLCSCRIELRMPILISHENKRIDGSLSIKIVLGDVMPNGGLDRETIELILEYEDYSFVSSGQSGGFFEYELLDIQRQLPNGDFILACINCLYSDYSPYGHASFGGMMCFRNLKTEYLKVKSKDDFWSVHDRYDRFVQETYLCPEFERRVPGTGYRG